MRALLAAEHTAGGLGVHRRFAAAQLRRLDARQPERLRLDLISAPLAASELEDRRGANGRQFVEAVMSPDDHGVHRSVGGEHAEHLLAHRRVAYANHLTFGMSRVCERAEEVEHRRDPELAPHRYRMAHRGVKARREAEPDAGLGDALGHAGGAEIDHHPERFKDVS